MYGDILYNQSQKLIFLWKKESVQDKATLAILGATQGTL